jgi:ABC-type transport system involved in multi-copper enzyme maturation permease subunit
MMNLRVRQTAAVARFELKKFLLARRWLGVYVLGLAPVLLMYARTQIRGGEDSLFNASQGFATVFQFFILRFGIFISCAVVFTQVFRGEILEKTLHLYLLAPVRREIIAVGKYLAGVALVAFLFSVSTAATLLLRYSHNGMFGSYFFEGDGFSQLVRYVAVAVLASIVYGAEFLLIGLKYKNPGVPTLFLFAWETFSFALPSMLQRLTVVYYLLPILPVKADAGPFSIVVDPVSPVFGVPITLALALVFVSISGWYVRSVQITYSAD